MKNKTMIQTMVLVGAAIAGQAAEAVKLTAAAGDTRGIYTGLPKSQPRHCLGRIGVTQRGWRKAQARARYRKLMGRRRANGRG